MGTQRGGASSCGFLLPLADVDDPSLQRLDFCLDDCWSWQALIDLAGLAVQQCRASPEGLAHDCTIGIGNYGELDEARCIHLA